MFATLSCAAGLVTAARAADQALLVLPPSFPMSVAQPLADQLTRALGRSVQAKTAEHTTAASVIVAAGENPAPQRLPAGLFATAPMVLVARADLPALDGADLIVAVKAAKGILRIAHAGEGTPSERCATRFIEHVGPLAVIVGDPSRALVEQRADIACLEAPRAVPLARAGAATAHIVAAEERLPALWDVPTGPELGIPLFTTTTWYGVYTASAVDAAHANAAVQSYLAVDANTQALADVGIAPFPLTHRSIDAHRAFLENATR